MKILKKLKKYIKRLNQSKVYYLKGELTPELALEALQREPGLLLVLPPKEKPCACNKAPKIKKLQTKSKKEVPKGEWILLSGDSTLYKLKTTEGEYLKKKEVHND